jgi:hypothetical protein
LQNSTYLDDDLVQVAESVHSHPMIIYPEHLQDPALSRHDVATRVIFYTGSQQDEPIINFIRRTAL